MVRAQDGDVRGREGTQGRLCQLKAGGRLSGWRGSWGDTGKGLGGAGKGLGAAGRDTPGPLEGVCWGRDMAS